MKVVWKLKLIGISEFEFSENDYFENDVLTKTYHLSNKLDEDDPLGYEGPEIIRCSGCEIKWKKDMNVTEKIVKKKQKHKGTGTGIVSSFWVNQFLIKIPLQYEPLKRKFWTIVSSTSSTRQLSKKMKSSMRILRRSWTRTFTLARLLRFISWLIPLERKKNITKLW